MCALNMTGVLLRISEMSSFRQIHLSTCLQSMTSSCQVSSPQCNLRLTSILSCTGWWIAAEFAKIKIRECKWNREWIETCWGTDFLNKIGDNQPVCSGTIMGTPAGFCALKKAMLGEMAVTSKMKGWVCVSFQCFRSLCSV